MIPWVSIQLLTWSKGDIQEIHWALYSKTQQDESALPNRTSSEGEEDSAYFLQVAEYILREDGHHVLLDKDKAGVWVFSLSQALDEGIVRHSGLDGLDSGIPCLSYRCVH